MGNNPMNRCYIVGYSENSAKHPHHRAAHGSKTFSMLDPEGGHWWEVPTLTISMNAAFVGACAGLYYYYGEALGHKPVPNFPPKEEAVEEYYVEGKIERKTRKEPR